MTHLPPVPRRVKADDENMERIHLAARKGQTDEVKRLVEVGVDPATENRFGCTALHLACKFGQVETAKFLASVCDVQGSWHGQKPLHLAVLSNQLALVQALVDGAKQRGGSLDAFLNDCDEMEVTQIGEHFKQCSGQTALHWCVGLGAPFLDMLKLLVTLGASPTAKDKNGETPLMRAIEFNNSEAMTAMLDLSTPSALRLDFADKQGRSHLHWAILNNHQDYALRFVDMGHDVNMEDEEHTVPLYLSVRAAMVPLTEQLLERGDIFLVQNAPFHNGKVVLADRVQWLSFVVNSEEDRTAEKQQVLVLLQNKLDEIIASLAPESDGTTKKKKRASVKKMNLAPSAPVRARSRSKTRKSTIK